ncbi:hypothetical protein C0J52_23512 [Blattella germanica]|nr:hypothetical protein C0J52_23512 [Blattella germanica]
MIFFVIVMPHFDYCDTLLTNLSSNLAERLQHNVKNKKIRSFILLILLVYLLQDYKKYELVENEPYHKIYNFAYETIQRDHKQDYKKYELVENEPYHKIYNFAYETIQVGNHFEIFWKVKRNFWKWKKWLLI